MSMAAVQNMDAQRPVIMFVDDEQRVLKSMRAMFRRDYEVHLASSGVEALELIAHHDIDVVVSDQRMPGMTGVEVLTQIKQSSPKTVRILLTGYADLAAIEASLNEAEVFKYLMKPCPADEVRGAVRQGLEMRAECAPVAVADVPRAQSNVTPLKVRRQDAAKPIPASDEPTRSVQILVLSEDQGLVSGIRQACTGHELHHAKDIADALLLAQTKPVGVLVTDVGIAQKEIAELSSAMRRITPNIVIILASDRSDANELIQLINSGRVFRFLLKPLHAGQCKIWLASALRRFVQTNRMAMAGPDLSVVEPSAWVRFKHWFLGMQV